MKDKKDTWSVNQERKDWVFSSMNWFIFLWKLLKTSENHWELQDRKTSTSVNCKKVKEKKERQIT